MERVIGDGSGQPRGTKPDDIHAGSAYLLKACRHLRLTYQIRLTAAMAASDGLKVEIRLRPGATLSPSLKAFARDHGDLIRIVIAS